MPSVVNTKLNPPIREAGPALIKHHYHPILREGTVSVGPSDEYIKSKLSETASRFKTVVAPPIDVEVKILGPSSFKTISAPSFKAIGPGKARKADPNTILQPLPEPNTYRVRSFKSATGKIYTPIRGLDGKVISLLPGHTLDPMAEFHRDMTNDDYVMVGPFRREIIPQYGCLYEELSVEQAKLYDKLTATLFEMQEAVERAHDPDADKKRAAYFLKSRREWDAMMAERKRLGLVTHSGNQGTFMDKMSDKR